MSVKNNSLRIIVALLCVEEMVVITFTPLYGVQSTEQSCCYLLEVDDIGILLDCGWTDDFDVALLEPLAQVIDKIDLVLVSHPDLAHMGALPYAVGTLGLKAPVYATLPVYRMGEIVLYEAYQARTKDDASFKLFSLDDVDQVLETFIQLKYSQKLRLSGQGEGIYITPHAAGHLIGGSIWSIVKETDEIIYAVDYNHRADHILGKTFLESISRPTLLITDSMHLNKEQPKMKDRDERLKDDVVNTLRRGGDALIPCDSAGRVLEVLHVLDQYWIKLKLKYPIALLSTMSYYVPQAAQAMLEWCSERISKNFDIGKPNPFNFSHVHVVHDLEELDKLSSPKVILATSPTLAQGFAKDLFALMAPQPQNSIIFVTTPHPTSLSAQVQTSRQVVIQQSRNVPLEGAELAAYEAKERRRIQNEAELKAKEIEEAAMEDMMMGIAEYESEDDEDGGDGDVDMTKTTIVPLDKPTAQLRGSFRVGFGQFATARYPMFFAMEHKCEWDEYGEAIQPDEFKELTSTAKSRKRKGKAKDGTEDVNMEANEDDADTGGADEVNENRPMKTLYSTTTVDINAKVTFVDFDGLADGRAIKNCLDKVKPRKLILVHGTPETSSDLKSYVDSSIDTCEAVYCPNAKECIDIESDTTVCKVSLKESLYTTAHFQKVGSHDVAYINGMLDFHGTQCTLDKADVELPHAPMRLSQGKITLDSMKQLLAKAGFKANFSGGMLVCDDGVVLKRARNNEIMVEGTLSASYYRIREILYSQYTLV
ncbi:cleavage and polyadenylation specificity factor subunit [Thraustotheca clavata]|uniref:Cleavage and polyadenylation specificity factor subunit 2 n=1 Tax=Thraustotheca clavata TaxID=74557 RepID=A0A1V9ZVQ4_9STRA|nr:cleavage and polyadenylation specificity factor subunit [Thraustotheca clavata]